MVCDYMGAGKAYYGDAFTIEKEYEWWQNKKSKPLAMHKNDFDFLNRFFESLKEFGEEETFEYLKKGFLF